MSDRARTWLIGGACAVAGLVLGVGLTLVWVGSGQGEYQPDGARRRVPAAGSKIPGRTSGKRSPPTAAAGEDGEDTGEAGEAGGGEGVETDRPEGEAPERLLPTRRRELGHGQWAGTTTVSHGGEGHAAAPVFSPDGAWVAFTVVGGRGGSTLHLVEAGTAATSSAVAPGFRASMHPAWHRQGLLVFAGRRSDVPQTRLFYALPGEPVAALLPADLAPGDLAHPAHTADGNQVAFTAGEHEIQAWDRHTGVLTLRVSAEGEVRYPTPSPVAGADALLYTLQVDGDADVRLADADGDVLVAGGEGDQARPAWVDEHTVVHLHEGSDGHWSIRRQGLAGERAAVLAAEVSWRSWAQPALTEDGRWLAWAPEGGRQLVLTRLDGGSEVVLETPSTACGELALGRRGERTLLAWTALPSPQARWRALQLADITETIAE